MKCLGCQGETAGDEGRKADSVNNSCEQHAGAKGRYQIIAQRCDKTYSHAKKDNPELSLQGDEFAKEWSG